MSDLTPCRFCRFAPHAWLDDYINGRAVTDPEYIIECENGNCSVMPEVRGTYPYMDEVRALWNAANALSAVQPDAATLIRWHDMLMRDYPADLSSIVCAEMLALVERRNP